MSKYQVIARKYRPQSFSEVVGQDAIVTTLKNAIKNAKLAHAYLFCGSRGTGKTTLARIFAKALNCSSPSDFGEPCGICHSCKEIASGISLDVFEIDGASHRGIDDIRQINDTVGYASSGGKYKVYIIDEVHMLTKEAFNALLKTLEEPPPNVLFIFATTEPHKVLPTILSRCQRFNLNRIPSDKIILKLRQIADQLGVEIDDSALRLLARRADGGLRDAESLMDQIIAFHEGKITSQVVADILGIISQDVFFQMDLAGKEGKLAVAFEIIHQVFSEGKDLTHFIESLTDHFRTLLLVKLSGVKAPFLELSESDLVNYDVSAKLYTQEQCLSILEYLVGIQEQMRFQSSVRIALETVLLHIMRTHARVPVEVIVRRLAELEEGVKNAPKSPVLLPEQTPQFSVQSEPALQEIRQKKPLLQETEVPKVKDLKTQSMTIDPSPSAADLGARRASPLLISNEVSSLSLETAIQSAPSPVNLETAVSRVKDMSKQSRYDTLMQFAAIELEGNLRKH